MRIKEMCIFGRDVVVFSVFAARLSESTTTSSRSIRVSMRVFIN